MYKENKNFLIFFFCYAVADDAQSFINFDMKNLAKIASTNHTKNQNPRHIFFSFQSTELNWTIK